MLSLTMTFDTPTKMADWITRAISRQLLPQDVSAVETEPQTYVLTDVRSAFDGEELAFARPDPMATTDTQDQRQAIIWLLHALLAETDSLQALEASNLDPASVAISGSDIVLRNAQGVPFLVQALPLSSPGQ